MSETKLKPCPFCGGKPNYNGIESRFSCTECGADTGLVLYRGYRFKDVFEKAIAAWNRRGIETELIEALEYTTKEICTMCVNGESYCKDSDCVVKEYKQLIARAKGDQNADT